MTLDGRMLFKAKAKVMASEHYNTRLEAELVSRLGVRFVERPSPGDRRPVREIEGVDRRLLEAWSSRRQAIEQRQRRLSARFRTDHGRVPTAIESLALAQQANLETRPAKHEPYAAAEQRAHWRRQACELVGGDVTGDEDLVPGMVSRDVGREGVRGGYVRGYDDGDVPEPVVAARVLDALEASRSTWQIWHVKAEALRQARAAEVSLDRLDGYVANVVRGVLEDLSVRVGSDGDLGEPDALRRPGGASAYTVHGNATYTSTRILEAERGLLDLAVRADGRVIGEGRVRLAVDSAAMEGHALNPSQAEMVRRLATSGSRVQVALAPAGSGKTTTLAVLTRAWEDGGGTVIGLAPTAVAAEELGTATGARGDTLAKLVLELETRDRNTYSAEATIERGLAAQFGPRPLVLIDEAAMASTGDLSTVVTYAIDRGASVRLVGDDQQLGSVAAGGAFRDLAELGQLHGTTVKLTELHRFADQAEAAATLGIRDGDPAALDFYLTHGRVHAGDVDSATDEAYAAWRADVAAGRSSLLLAPGRDMVRDLNERAREERLAALRGPVGREARLADGTSISHGDVVITRQNDRSLRTRSGSWVKNGDRWTVVTVDASGGLIVERIGRHHAKRGARVVLPAAYVREHLQLGYANTIHGAQGATVDTTHTVLASTETRQSLYVAVSRGRQSNHVYLGSPGARLDAVGLDPETTPVEARDILTAILERDGRPQSATTTQHGDAAVELRDAVLRYQDALPTLAEQVLGAGRMRALDEALERWYPGLTSQPAYPGLRGRVALRWADGETPNEVLRAAAWFDGTESLARADDPAAVLAWRVGDGVGLYGDGPLPWLPSIPRAVRDDADAAAYLKRVVSRVGELTERVVDDTTKPSARDSTPWLRAVLEGADLNLIADLAVWRAVEGVPVTDTRPTGPPARGPLREKHQARLDWRLELAQDPNLRPEVEAEMAVARSAAGMRPRAESRTPSLATRESMRPAAPPR